MTREKAAPAPLKAPGVGVVKLLGAAAVLGLGTGAALSLKRASDDVPEKVAASAVEEVMPVGVQAAQTADMMAPDPRSLQGIPAYPRAVPRRLMNGTTSENGVGAVSWFETSDSLDAVMSFYEQAFSQANMSSTSHRYSPRRGYVAWMQHFYDDAGMPTPGEGLLHMVAVSDEGSRTMVFLSATEPQHMFDNAPVLPGGIRLPSGARPQIVRTGEVGQEHATVFSTFKFDRQTLLTKVEEIAREDGWKLSEKAVSAEGKASLVFRRGEFVQVAAVEGTSDTSQVLITVEQHPQQPNTPE